MTLAQIDTLELELRKLDGVRTVGFSTAQEAIYIQLFIDAKSKTGQLPFEATRIAKRHTNQSVAVELVRSNFVDGNSVTPNDRNNPAYIHNDDDDKDNVGNKVSPFSAGTIGITKQKEQQMESSKQKTATHADFFRPTGNAHETSLEVPSNSFNEDEFVDDNIEINLNEEEQNQPIRDDKKETTPKENLEKVSDRIELLLVSTSPENDEIEIHLSLGDTRTIGRAPSNRGLLGAIDSTVNAISELCGINEFHGEWARSLEPGAEHASLVAVGLINDQGNETRHGIAGGKSPIEAAARATLNALNRVATLTNS